MGTLDQLSGQSLTHLSAHVVRLQHDLGKYVSMHQRWLPPSAGPETVADAVRSDLLHTRRAADGHSLDAVAVWESFRPGLFGEAVLEHGAPVDISDEPIVKTLAEQMSTVSALVRSLREDSVPDQELKAGALAAVAVSELCRELRRQVRAALDRERGEEGG